MAPRAIVLLSGGLDSTTCMAVARRDGFDPVALSVRYGQRNQAELRAAQRVATAAGATHVVTTVDLGAFGGSALTGDGEVPKHDLDHPVGSGPIPVTYVPARNTVLLALAVALAEVHEASDIFIGVNATDYSGYPDCRPEFVAAFEQVANLATRAATEGGRRCHIHAPLIDLSKAEIIQLGRRLGVDHAATSSCYDPDDTGAACGRCDACILRRRGFRDAGIPDPTRYREGAR